jgi:hypothetical protein
MGQQGERAALVQFKCSATIVKDGLLVDGISKSNTRTCEVTPGRLG